MTFIGVLYTLATLETEGMRCEVRDIFVRLDILLRPPPAGSLREGVWWREDPSLMLFRTIFARWLDEGDAVRCTGAETSSHAAILHAIPWIAVAAAKLQSAHAAR